MKPSQQIKLKIKNLVMEYVQGKDKEHASSEFSDVCTTNNMKNYMVAGYIFNNAFSQTEANWKLVCSLVIDILFIEE